MTIRLSIAAAVAALAVIAMPATSEAGHARAHKAKAAPAKAAPAPRAHSCPLMERMRSHMTRVHTHVRTAHARPARAERPARVAHAAKKAPKK